MILMSHDDGRVEKNSLVNFCDFCLFSSQVSNADVVSQFNHKEFHIRSRCENATMEAGDVVHAFFYADTFKEVKGLKGKVRVTPYFQPRI